MWCKVMVSGFELEGWAVDMQAIETRFFGPGNVRGARVKASADAGSVWVSWDYALGVEDNHRAAADALMAKLGWDYVRIDGSGSLPRSRGFVFTLSPVRGE